LSIRLQYQGVKPKTGENVGSKQKAAKSAKATTNIQKRSKQAKRKK